jgi:long-chain acyl-CoA synthetase
VTKDFDWETYADFGKQCTATRGALADLGIGPGSKVGIISNNRKEWAATACAAYSLNAVCVPMYEAQLPKEWEYILNDSGCNALFCANEEILKTANTEVVGNVASLATDRVLSYDAPAGADFSFAAALQRAEGKNTPVFAPKADDLANLIYTSGTTGKPKGVELTHNCQVRTTTTNHM